MGDPVALHDRGRVLQSQRLGQRAGGEERAAGAEDHRDLVDDHLVDQPELERLGADLTGGYVDVPVAGELLGGGDAFSTSSTKVNGAVSAMGLRLVIPERVLSWIVGVSSTAAVCVVLVAMTSVNQAAAAKAGDTPALLNDVARVYSLGVGEVRCASQLEWGSDPHRTRFSWGYTNVRGDYIVLPPLICAGAMNVGNISVPA